MSVVRQMKASHQSDPRREIDEKVGDISEMQLADNHVLAAVYVRPDSLDLGGGKRLYLTDSARKEDEYQGKAALILKCGPKAFSEEPTDFMKALKPGDWVVHRASDGWPLKVKGVLCTMIHYSDVRAIIPRPDYVY